MAKDWYLIQPPNRYSGYETDTFENQAASGFHELLNTFIAEEVELCSFDLSECKKIKAVVQGSVSSTTSNTMNREFLIPVGTCKAGMYFKYQDSFWLVTGFVDNNGMYEKALASLCQFKLRWQDRTGKIIERWANLTSVSKSDVGETGNKIIILTSSSYSILVPNDEETMGIDGKRVFIDKNEGNPSKVFKITRSNDTEYDYGVHGGILNLIADKVEMNPNTDNPELGICDYLSPASASDTPNPPQPEQLDVISHISGRSDLKIHHPRTYCVSFTNSDGTELSPSNINFSWNIVSDFKDKITKTINGDTIELSVGDDSLLNEAFLLQVVIDGNVSSEMTVVIKNIY